MAQGTKGSALTEHINIAAAKNRAYYTAHSIQAKAYSKTWRAEHPEQRKAMRYKWRADHPGYDMALYVQKQEVIAGRKKPARCEICGKTGAICFDHCHKSKKFRGWICSRCNHVLGCIKDSSKLLYKLANYLEISELKTKSLAK